MANHIHMLVGVPDDPDPVAILRDFKAYGSRRLNRQFNTPAGQTWWTTGGSTRKLPDATHIPAVANYIQQQSNPHLIWTRDDGQLH